MIYQLANILLFVSLALMAAILLEPFAPVLLALARRQKPKAYDVQVVGMSLTVMGLPFALIGLGAGLIYSSLPALMVGLGAVVLFLWGLVLTSGRGKQ